MQVIAGSARRIQLKTLPGDHTRPTSNQVKETLFNILRDETEGAVFLDLFAGRNDYEGMRRAGVGGHKEINRTNLSLEEVEELLSKEVVSKQLELLRFRNTCPVFTEDAEITVDCNETVITITWTNACGSATLTVDFDKDSYQIETKL